MTLRCCACDYSGVDADGDGAPVSGACADDFIRDCNGADPAIHPGAPDTPGDGIDQNCDGVDGERTWEGSMPGGEMGGDAALTADARSDRARDDVAQYSPSQFFTPGRAHCVQPPYRELALQDAHGSSIKEISVTMGH